MKETVLVSGGAGYIGTHTTVELIEAGYDVVIVDKLSNSEMEAVEGVRKITGVNVPFEQVDCTDKEALGRVFDQYKFNSIIHFAASKAVGESVEKPLLYYRNNLQSLITILELMRDKGVRNIVFSSSCTVYGQPDVLLRMEIPNRSAKIFCGIRFTLIRSSSVLHCVISTRLERILLR